MIHLSMIYAIISPVALRGGILQYSRSLKSSSKMATQPYFVSILGNFRSLRNVDKNHKKKRPDDHRKILKILWENFTLSMRATYF